MKTTHIGKIGRLSRRLRNELGLRLEDGQDGSTILGWLNGQTEAQRTLEIYFEGRPITAQNLSEWRQTGHQEWVRQQEAIGYVNGLCEQGQEMDRDQFSESVSDRLAAVLAGELMRTAEELRAQTGEPQARWEQLCALNRELERLRQQDHRAEELRARREKWEAELDRTLEAERKNEEQKAQEDMLAQLMRATDRTKKQKEMARDAKEELYLMKCGKNWLALHNDLFPRDPKKRRQQEKQLLKGELGKSRRTGGRKPDGRVKIKPMIGGN